MTASSAQLPGRTPLTARSTWWLLVGLHVLLVAGAVGFTAFGMAGAPTARHPTLVVVDGLALGALQLRHSLAAARGQRPRAWPATLLAMAVLAYLPLPWWPSWVDAQYLLMASALMVLRGRTRVAVFAAMALFAGGWVNVVLGTLEVAPVDLVRDVQVAITYAAVPLLLFAAIRLVRLLEELQANRAELADLAVRRERLRLSRDLHDLLGQSLSAVSLKGELALRLLPTDPDGARGEVMGLTTLARDTLHGMRAVTRDEHAVSLRAETDGAAALLTAAGIDITVDLDRVALSPAVDEVFGWAVREAVTNILRHSDARSCSIDARIENGATRLEIRNDGAHASVLDSGDGSGLAGLTARAERLSGSVTAEHTHPDRFQLTVELPQEAR